MVSTRQLPRLFCHGKDKKKQPATYLATTWTLAMVLRCEGDAIAKTTAKRTLIRACLGN